VPPALLAPEQGFSFGFVGSRVGTDSKNRRGCRWGPVYAQPITVQRNNACGVAAMMLRGLSVPVTTNRSLQSSVQVILNRTHSAFTKKLSSLVVARGSPKAATPGARPQEGAGSFKSFALETSDRRFPRRQNADGTVDSICPRCFVTVATTKCETELEAQEREHICDATDLDRLWQGQIHRTRAQRIP